MEEKLNTSKVVHVSPAPLHSMLFWDSPEISLIPAMATLNGGARGIGVERGAGRG